MKRPSCLLAQAIRFNYSKVTAMVNIPTPDRGSPPEISKDRSLDLGSANGPAMPDLRSEALQGKRFEISRGAQPECTPEMRRAAEDVTAALKVGKGNPTSVNKAQVVADYTVGGMLGKNTHEPPLSQDTYAATVTRPYETALMKALNVSRAPTLTYGDIAKTAMAVCGDDAHLAALTLANWSKNLTSAVRGQIPAGPISSNSFEVTTYSSDRVKSITSRLEQVAHGYDAVKEGGFYHYFGAVAAESVRLGAGVEIEIVVFDKQDKYENAMGILGKESWQNSRK